MQFVFFIWRKGFINFQNRGEGHVFSHLSRRRAYFTHYVHISGKNLPVPCLFLRGKIGCILSNVCGIESKYVEY